MSEILKSVLDTARGLFECGAIDEEKMNKFDQMCSPKIYSVRLYPKSLFYFDTYELDILAHSPTDAIEKAKTLHQTNNLPPAVLIKALKKAP